MIKTEIFEINGKSYTKTWSTIGFVCRDGICYSEAIDPTELGRTYTEVIAPTDNDDEGYYNDSGYDGNKTQDGEDDNSTNEDLTEEIDLNTAIDRKINELSELCEMNIEYGVDVLLSNGNVQHFSMTIQDQLNLISLSAMVEQGMTEIPYHADDESCIFYSPEDINAIVEAGTSLKTYHVTYFNSLKIYVKSLTNIEDVMSCYYGMDIPEEYQSEVYKKLLNG